jgi:V/A-type H+-transporting ATPase subunit F
VLCFKAVGVDVFPALDSGEAGRIFRRLVKNKYVVIFITEQLARELEEELEEVAYEPLPSVVLIPNNKGSLGLAQARVRETVMKAVGADIFAEKEEA